MSISQMFDGLNELLPYFSKLLQSIFLMLTYFHTFQILFQLHSNAKGLRQNISPKPNRNVLQRKKSI